MPYHLVIDLEATCWPERHMHRGENEIIEIGLAVLSPERQLIHSESWFVRPSKHPNLSEFCTNLTHIQQTDVDSAPLFPEQMQKFEATVQRLTGCPVKDSLFVSWGNYDRSQLELECRRHGYLYPFGEHLNLKVAFAKSQGIRPIGLASALERLNLPFVGMQHRGIDDAVNTAKILQIGMPE